MAHESDFNIAVKERVYVKKPDKYVVIMHNDDYTTMNFVVSVLVEVFSKKQEEAMQIMLDVHRKGQGICGVFLREIAETKIEIAHEKAKTAGYPLRCSMEKE